ncbi:MAG: hypothetical protein JO353_13005 [Phycisphaerae bacterium]|nr:hypothetical protein [Phycisphaerae bacterium]
MPEALRQLNEIADEIKRVREVIHKVKEDQQSGLVNQTKIDAHLRRQDEKQDEQSKMTVEILLALNGQPNKPEEGMKHRVTTMWESRHENRIYIRALWIAVLTAVVGAAAAFIHVH